MIVIMKTYTPSTEIETLIQEFRSWGLTPETIESAAEPGRPRATALPCKSLIFCRELSFLTINTERELTSIPKGNIGIYL